MCREATEANYEALARIDQNGAERHFGQLFINKLARFLALL